MGPTGITTSDPELSWGLDPKSKQVRVANFHRGTVKACMEVMEATGVKSWSEINPKMVLKRVAVGKSMNLQEIYEHLRIQHGELLESDNNSVSSSDLPQRLVNAWNDSKATTTSNSNDEDDDKDNGNQVLDCRYESEERVA